MKAKELTEKGLEIDPKNVLLAHTYASIVLRLNSRMSMNHHESFNCCCSHANECDHNQRIFEQTQSWT
jgi:hypothetical protein